VSSARWQRRGVASPAPSSNCASLPPARLSAGTDIRDTNPPHRHHAGDDRSARGCGNWGAGGRCPRHGARHRLPRWWRRPGGGGRFCVLWRRVSRIDSIATSGKTARDCIQRRKVTAQEKGLAKQIRQHNRLKGSCEADPAAQPSERDLLTRARRLSRAPARSAGRVRGGAARLCAPLSSQGAPLANVAQTEDAHNAQRKHAPNKAGPRTEVCCYKTCRHRTQGPAYPQAH
jgi:hypothetical protein